MINNHLINSVDVFIDPQIDAEDIRLFLSAYIPENPEIRFSMIDRVLLGLRL